MKLNLLILVFLVLASSAIAATTEELQSLWTSWKLYNNKQYAVEEDTARFAIFADNYYTVIKFNAENENPKLGLNNMADLSADEFKSQYTGKAFRETDQTFIEENSVKPELTDNIPGFVDWRLHDAVTRVKDQGRCDSDWAFSATGVLEGFYSIKNNILLPFSEQQIIDCDRQHNDGCDGGSPYIAIHYAAVNGLEIEFEYPYTGRVDYCSVNKGKTVSIAGGFAFVDNNSTDSLKAAIASMPVSVLIEADQDIFRLYSSGIIYRDCGNDVNHAALAVGYGRQGLFDAFIVKNSWGTGWGSGGYVYIATTESVNDGSGVCGILTQPVIATD